MRLKPFLLLSLLLPLLGCQSRPSLPPKLSLGAVSLGETEGSVQQYQDLKNYLSQELQSLIELEPTYNELKALDQVKRQNWDLVFAPPGVAAIAISESDYVPILPLESRLKGRSVFVVLQDSPLSALNQLAGQVVALGERGSATGYYFPIYNLYGLTLGEIRLASTPKIALSWIASGEVAAGAMSLDDFNRYRSDFPGVRFRILHADSHPVPSGVVLLSPHLEGPQRDAIRKVLVEAPPTIAASAGYIANAPIPNYDDLIEVVQRVRPIAERIQAKPAPLYEQPGENGEGN